MISSLSNNQIKNLIQLQTKASARKKQGLFVVEGIKMFLETPPELIESIFVSDELMKDKQVYKKINEKFLEAKKLQDSIEIIPVTHSIFKEISGTVTPQGVIAVVRQCTYSFEDILRINENGKRTVLILDDLRDPGNMGTIIRTAEGAGISGILMNSECVDIYNPKVTRSTMGSLFRVPIYISSELSKDIGRLKEAGIVIFAAHLKGREYSEHPEFKKDVGILIGNEANGISEEIAETADEWIKIPMCGELESLNAAVAAAILMYEARR